MKLVIDIKESNVPEFLELMKTHNIIKDVKELKKNKRESKLVKGIAQSFKEIKLHMEGKKELKNAKDFINELRSQNH